MTNQPQEQPAASGWNTNFPGSDKLPTVASDRLEEPTNDQIREQEAAMYALEAAKHVLAKNSAAAQTAKPKRVRDPKARKNHLKGAAITATAGLLVGGALYGVASSDVTPTVEQKPASDPAVEKANQTARDIANGTITILSKQGASIYSSTETSVGSEVATEMKNGKPDERLITYAFFNSEDGELTFSTTRVWYPKGVEHDKDYKISFADVTYDVMGTNSLYGKTGPITLDDVEQSLSEVDTITMKKADVTLHGASDSEGGSTHAPYVSMHDDGPDKNMSIAVYPNGLLDYDASIEGVEGESSFFQASDYANTITKSTLDEILAGVYSSPKQK